MSTYMEQAHNGRNNDTTIYPEYINAQELSRCFQGFVAASKHAEKLKKAIFKGQNLPKFPTISPVVVSDEEREILHANLGVMGESHEFVEADTREDVLLEAGDLIFYITVKLRKYGITLEEVLDGNLNKLRNRYPERFADVPTRTA